MSLFGLGKRGEELAKGLIDLLQQPQSAKGFVQQGTNPDYLVQQGLLAPEQINNPRAIQGAQNRYLKHSLESPEFLSRELGYQNNPIVTSQIQQPPRNIIMPEDIEGMVLKSHAGDRTVTDKSIESIGGIDLEPVQSRGGVGYGSSPLTPEANYWGSNLGAAQSLQNSAEKLEGLLDKPVAGVYAAMGREGNFFNQAFADALQQQVDKTDLPKEAIEHFDNMIRTMPDGRPDWVGLRHPDARKQLLGIDGYPQKGAGKLRSMYVQQMDKAAYKNQGFPLVQPLLNELIEPDLANVAKGDSGYIMGQIGKDFGLSPDANHPSYDTGIMGRVIGGFPVSVPSRVMYPDAYKILDEARTVSGKPYSATEMINALSVRHDMYQIATPEWVDSVSDWISKNPKGSAQALMAAVGMPMAIGSSEEAEAGVLNKIKAFHGSPHDFDKFSSDYIGTGEGAQAFGRGLYLAERRKTAESYRDALTKRDMEYEDWLADQYSNAEKNQDFGRMEMYERAMMHDLPKDFRELAKDTDYDEDYRELASQVADELEAFTKADGTKPNFGKMYEVEIDAAQDELLDFDQPLDDQPEKIKKLLAATDWHEYAEDALYERMMDSNPTGGSLLRYLEEEGDGYASQALRDAGIKGIKYADAQTRFSPKGKTHNYVIFDDKLIDITRKYGMTPILLPQAVKQAMAMSESEARKGMSRKERRDNPASENLQAYAKDRAGRAVGEMGLGLLEGVGEGVDFLRPENLASMYFGLPQINTSAQDALQPVTGMGLLRDDEGKDTARLIGSLLSPI